MKPEIIQFTYHQSQKEQGVEWASVPFTNAVTLSQDKLLLKFSSKKCKVLGENYLWPKTQPSTLHGMIK